MGASGDQHGKMAAMTGTDTVHDAPAQPAGPASAPPDIGGMPTWLRRTLIAVVLLSALAIAVWGVRSAGTSDENQLVKGAIVGLSPPNDGQALRQTAVGADLAPGYDGRLTVNGIPIPEAQMEGARDPETVSAADLAKNGLRPNNRNSVFFKPGPGKVIEEFDHGTVTIALDYFLEEQQETTSNRVTWTIRVD
jgi:hypothetical protein